MAILAGLYISKDALTPFISLYAIFSFYSNTRLQRLIRNTEMKSALLNLADIAGIKINIDNNQKPTRSAFDQAASKPSNQAHTADGYININILRNSTDPQAFSHFLKSVNLNKANNTTYTRYIEMAYQEVSTILAKDKQTLIENLRKVKNNQNKLMELEQLKVKVSNSLARLSAFEAQNKLLISRESEISNILLLLEKKIKFNQFNGSKAK